MFDTIHIEIPNQYIKGLKNRSDTIDSETGEVKYSVGYTGCIKIRNVRDGMLIECSLSKLLKGNNIYSLSYLEVTLALEMIEDKLGIPIEKGIIRRLDCEYTIETQLKPEEYFRYFGDCRYFRRSTIQNSSLYYSNGSRVINIYDKIKEIKNKRGIIPEDFKNTNLIRCEFRYKNKYLKNITKEMGIECLQVENLLDKKIYNKLAELVYLDYKSITKIKKSYFDSTTLASKAKFIEQFAILGIEVFGGFNVVMEHINASKSLNPNVPLEYFSRRKNDIKEVMRCKCQGDPANIIDEINEKIEHIYLKNIIDDTK